MRTIHLYFEGGFKGDAVSVKAGAEELARRDGLTSDYSPGLAGSLRIDVPAELTAIEIDVPTRGVRGVGGVGGVRGIRGTVPVEPGEDVLYLEVWIDDDALRWAWSAEAPLFD